MRFVRIYFFDRFNGISGNGHDIKLVMTDVRNQDDTLRGPSGQFSGSARINKKTAKAMNISGQFLAHENLREARARTPTAIS